MNMFNFPTGGIQWGLSIPLHGQGEGYSDGRGTTRGRKSSKEELLSRS